jgi:hypothetical protein
MIAGAIRTGVEVAAKRVPLLKRLPVIQLILVAEIALVANKHLQLLTPVERRRLAYLVRHGRHLSDSEKQELRALVGKLEPRAFAGAAATRVSPVPLPKRLTKARF